MKLKGLTLLRAGTGLRTHGRKLMLLPLLSLLSLAARAAEEAAVANDPEKLVQVPERWGLDLKIMMWVLLGIALVLIYIVTILSVKNPTSFSWKGFMDSITAKNAKDEMMDHAYDGIQELNNPVPNYLQLILYGSIGFGIFYLFHFHILKTGPSQEQEYLTELAEAKEKYKNVELPDEALVLLTSDAELGNGKVKFNELCAPCHLVTGGGDVGPNLTDEYWLHGGSVKDIYKTITNGVAGKGMISWKSQLTSTQRLEVASYIKSLAGSNPPNPKAPQGTKYVEGADNDADAEEDAEVPAGDSENKDAESDGAADTPDGAVSEGEETPTESDGADQPVEDADNQ